MGMVYKFRNLLTGGNVGNGEATGSAGATGAPGASGAASNAECEYNDYTLKLLSDGEIFFAFAKQFEDIEDCRIKIYCRGSKVEKMQFHRDFIAYPPPNSLKRWSVLGIPEKTFLKRIAKMGLEEFIPPFGICCFSKSWQGVKNWVKHASNQGICVGFGTIEEKYGGSGGPLEEMWKQYTGEIFPIYEPKIPADQCVFLLSKVLYEVKSKRKVNLIPLETLKFRAMPVVLKKNKKYEYEDEVRTFATMDKTEDNEELFSDKGITLHASLKSIKEVTFAQDISEASKNKVVEMLRSHRQCVDNIKFFKCTGIDLEGKMQREQIQP